MLFRLCVRAQQDEDGEQVKDEQSEIVHVEFVAVEKRVGGHYHHYDDKEKNPRNLKKPKRHAPEMIGKLRLSSTDPRSRTSKGKIVSIRPQILMHG